MPDSVNTDWTKPDPKPKGLAHIPRAKVIVIPPTPRPKRYKHIKVRDRHFRTIGKCVDDF